MYNKKLKLKTSKQNKISEQHKRFAANLWNIGV